MVFTVDDLCLKYLENFRLFDEIKNEMPDFTMIAFTISNFNNKEDLSKSSIFKDWYGRHKTWVEIAVHSYDHIPPPDGDRENEEVWILKAKKSLQNYLPSKPGYRSPGWQTTNKTIPILKRLGFSYIAYETKINYLNEKRTEGNVVNSHLYDINSIKRLAQFAYSQKKMTPVSNDNTQKVDEILLDIGCGSYKQKGFMGMDKRKVEGVDIIHDLEVFPYPLESDSCAVIIGNHIVEHIKPWLMIEFMNELWRIMKVGGKLILTMPYGANHFFVQDPTHCNPCNEITWQYFDPTYNLFKVYFPKPWKIEKGFPKYAKEEYLEVHMRKEN